MPRTDTTPWLSLWVLKMRPAFQRATLSHTYSPPRRPLWAWHGCTGHLSRSGVWALPLGCRICDWGLRLGTRQCRDQRIRVPPARPRLLSLLPLISPDLHVPRMVRAQQAINARPCAVQVEAEIGGQLGRLIRPRPAARVELLQQPCALRSWVATRRAVFPVLLIREPASEQLSHLRGRERLTNLIGCAFPHDTSLFP